jgi:2-polyprenyl-3-methyl-5-hydroxy-6-metoxy-1,4-benzoquinol methylase
MGSKNRELIMKNKNKRIDSENSGKCSGKANNMIDEIIQKAEEYYDQFSTELVQDYVISNPRTVLAIRHILTWLPKGPMHILDIGCGIGWTSHDVAKNRPEAKVLGVDLASKSIEIAQKLFQRNNLKYAQKDITSKDFHSENGYDAVLLVDVYEHIPADARPFFHNSVAKVLNPGGRIILTCPTVLLQKWTRTNFPEGMQPVDLEIGIPDLQCFAENVAGDIIYFSYKNVWDTNDYFHAVIERRPQFVRRNRNFSEKLRDRLPFKKWLRSNRVKHVLQR